MELLTAEVKEKVCTGYLDCECITCDYFSRDLLAICAYCQGNVPGPCADCVSFVKCAYKARKLTCASVYGVMVCEDA